ncbi:hypothetical protein GCM10022252_59270 [Streptosporangium oxazolinicum]|uniref:Uncharacterized protein n=1 Tax=Streptosporangium oxazolinicum TaxID=909287 RepID=A0ABP8BBK1_9ACTN
MTVAPTGRRVGAGVLERRYRWLLRAYPRAYRKGYEGELVAILLATAEPGRTVPSARESLALLLGGLRARVIGTTERPAWADDRLRSAGDYQAMMKYREKYGFGMFAKYVYPDDPQARAGSTSELVSSPRVQADLKLQRSMSETQRAQWVIANETCYSEAIKELTGRTVTGEQDLWRQMGEISKRFRAGEIDGDPELVRLARDYGDCLRDRGVRVTSLKPTEVEMSAPSHFEAGLGAAAQLRDSVKGGIYTPAFSAEEAAPHLAREVKAAIEDLECGKDFYAAHRPKDDEVSKKVSRELGVSEALL